MFDFIFESIIWTLALYGLIEIVTTIYCICTNKKENRDNMDLIITVKNQENQIEGFCRSILFRYLREKKDYLNSIVIVDLNSTDNTCEIVKKLSNDYECIKLKEWSEYKKELDEICLDNIK